MVLFALSSLMAYQEIQPSAGMIINTTTKIKPGEYALANADNDAKSGVITIRGNNLTVDFQGATFLGSDWDTEPDKRAGTAIVVEGNNITIKNVKAHGYKIGLIARNSQNVKIQGCDFSYNWKQRLGSTDEREDLGDWMSFHKNENDEWLRFGAGIYLRNCNKAEVSNTRIIGGQCGLMMMESNDGSIFNNSFSFLSAIGLGMYKSSGNKVMHNNIDWCVRGYSHTRWNRGQDSAGILIYEQSNKNVFAYNSVTHGGDGFFLWAGQYTMDTGKGGCNDNLLYGNDFSHAPTNGIEATFSRNKFVNNLLMECWHAIWGGYSFDSEVVGNIFGYNAQAIAWEHGQNNRVVNNMFYRDQEGIVLWQNKTQDPNWGYPKAKDTSSRDWIIRANEFNYTATNAFNLKDTKRVEILRNYVSSVGQFIKQEGDLTGLASSGNWLWLENKDRLGPHANNTVTYGADNKPQAAYLRPDGNNIESPWVETEKYLDRFVLTWAPYPKDPKPNRNMSSDKFMDEYYRATRLFAPAPLPNGKRPYLKEGQLRGRRYILVDEWGPYDFKSPKVWYRGEFNGKHRFEVLGPQGEWKVTQKKGIATLSAESGKVPATIDATFEPGKANELVLGLEFVGAEVVTPFGKKIKAGTKVPFEYRKFVAPIEWTVNFYNWKKEDVANPQQHMPLLSELNLGAPIKTLKTQRLDFGSSGAFFEGGPADYFATIAEGEVELPEGEYTLEATSDDGIRVFVDDRLVISDGWKYQVPTAYRVTLNLGGKHKIRVEHFEISGYSALKVGLKKNPEGDR